MKCVKKRIVLTKEYVLSDALKYFVLSDWMKKSRSCYVVASRNNWLEEASAHMDRQKRKKWKKEEILEISSKFDRMVDWIENSPSSYQAAIKLNLIEEIKAYMLPRSWRNLIWSPEEIFKDSALYESKTKWENASPSAVNAARRLGIYEEATKNMPINVSIGRIPHNKKWTKEAVLLDAKLYTSIGKWEDNSASAYHAALDNNWHEEATLHMPKYSRTTGPEHEIMQYVLKIFPDAKTKRFKNNTEKFSFKNMELDIFIPSLNKGIEFDGIYWHTPAVLKGGRPNWSNEDLKDYHLTKDTFFNLIGIPLLHIKGEDWKEDSRACLLAIDTFLKEKI